MKSSRKVGKASSAGNNTINVNGTGQFVQNSTANSISAVGDTFKSNGTALPAPRQLHRRRRHAFLGHRHRPRIGQALRHIAAGAPPGFEIAFAGAANRQPVVSSKQFRSSKVSVAMSRERQLILRGVV